MEGDGSEDEVEEDDDEEEEEEEEESECGCGRGRKETERTGEECPKRDIFSMFGWYEVRRYGGCCDDNDEVEEVEGGRLMFSSGINEEFFSNSSLVKRVGARVADL